MYKFHYFNGIHIRSILFYIIASAAIIKIPFYLSEKNKERYTKILGYFLIAFKIFDSLYRVFAEKEDWLMVIPLNLCNISLIIGGIFLVTRKDQFFQLLYFYFPGAILAILLPNITMHYTKFYVYVFMGAHILEIMAVIYSFIHLNSRVTKSGLKLAIIFYICLCIIARFVNNIVGSNYMFVNDYLISGIDFIKPINLYALILMSLYISSMFLFYIPFKNSEENK